MTAQLALHLNPIVFSVVAVHFHEETGGLAELKVW